MTRQPVARKRGIRLVSHETGVSTDGIVCSAVSPRFTEWVSELLTELRPHTEQIVRHHAGTEDPWRASSAILTKTVPEWTTLGNSWSDDTAEAVAYTRALTALALTYGDEEIDELSPYHQQRHADLIETTESVGTGRGSVNAGLGALAKGPVALHRELDDKPRTLTLLLDGPAWTNLADRRTGVRALTAIAVLADAFDVRVDGHRRWIVDDARTSISTGTWWPTAIEAPSQSTPLLSHRDTTDTGSVVNAYWWLLNRDCVSVHADTGALHLTATATNRRSDTSVPLNLRSRHRTDYMLQIQKQSPIRSRVQPPQHHTAQLATQPPEDNMEFLPSYPTTALVTPPTLQTKQGDETK